MNFKERRTEMIRRIEEDGWLDFNRSDFAKEMGVSAVQIHNDYHKYMSTISKTEIREIKKGMYNNYKLSIKRLLKIIKETNNPQERLKALELLSKIQSDWTTFLEKYGLKDSIADKVQIEGSISIKELIRKWKKD